MKKRVLEIIRTLKDLWPWRQKADAQKSYPFFALTPNDNAERIDAYCEAMDYAFTCKNIRNIAVTGPYGAGKSSFLNTYFKSKENVLRISLASFLGGVENAATIHAERNDGKDITDIAANERRLELSILQQIFYRFPADTVPYSRLCKTTTVSNKWYRYRVLWVVSALMGVLGVWQPDFFIPFVSKAFREWIAYWDKVIFWGSVGALLFLFAVLMNELLRLVKTKRIQSLDVSGLGIQMAENTDRSILNRNVDEIIYHFEASKYQTVIFEDIDRFENVDIFAKLREVNLLLNNAEQIPESHKPIRFVYALKEELFKEKTEKVKFFDFVIPIVPVVNASNSCRLLRQFLDERCHVNETNTTGLKKFIKDVSPYVSDMRLLKNICNEFYTYRRQIPDCTAPVELLGMIVFKNFFPREFAEMHQDDGLIKALLEVKDNAITAGIKLCEEEIDKCLKEIKAIDSEKSKDVDSLRKLYFYELMRTVGDEQYVEYGNTTMWTSSIIKCDDWFEMLRKGGIRYRGRYGQNHVQWKTIEESCDPSCTYDEHVQRIEGRQNDRINMLRNTINSLRNKQAQIRRMTLVDLMANGCVTNEAIIEVVPEEYVKWQEHELLLALVRASYINERYRYYISMFYEVAGTSSRTDYYFEVGVGKGAESDWGQKLEKPEEVVENIDLHYFATPAILNFSLAKELLKNVKTVKAQAFLHYISKENRRCYEFIASFVEILDSEGDAQRFFDTIFSINNVYMDELVSFSADGTGLPREVVERQLGFYIVWMLNQSEENCVSPIVRAFTDEAFNIAAILKKHQLVNPDKMKKFIETFAVKFKKLDFGAAKSTGLLDVMMATNAYAINPGMLKGILSAKDVSAADFDKCSWSLIVNSGILSLIKYVESNFKAYLNQVYLQSTAVQEDVEGAVLSVLNREDVEDVDKRAFLKMQWRKSRVEDVEKLKTQKILSFSIDEDWIVPSWENAVKIWNRNKNDLTPFWRFVGREECFTRLSVKNSRNMEWSEDVSWAKNFSESDQLSDAAVMGLLAGMSKGLITSYSGANATPERVEQLARAGRVQYSNDLFRNLKGRGNDSHISLVVVSISDFCDMYEDGLVDATDVMKILVHERLNRRKVPVLLNTLTQMIVTNKHLAEAAARLVNDGNYKEIDEQALDAVFAFLNPASFQCQIIQRLGGSAQDIRERLSRMSEPYKKLGGLGNRPELPRGERIETFLGFLKETGIVSSFEVMPNGTIRVNATRT